MAGWQAGRAGEEQQLLVTWKFRMSHAWARILRKQVVAQDACGASEMGGRRSERERARDRHKLFMALAAALPVLRRL